MIHRKVTVEGRVQGVSFRYYTRKMAKSLGVYGYVQNHENGNVYIEAEGETLPLQKFLDWCKTGPTMARVDNITIEEGELCGYDSFEIVR